MTDCSLLQVPLTGGSRIAVELKRRVLLREVNARIREMSDRFGTPEGFYRLICECGEEACVERLEVPAADYEELRLANEFLVCEAHSADRARGGPVAVTPALIPAEPLPLQ